MKLPKYIETAMSKLEAVGAEVFVVGGAVRDYLLEKEPQDYDLCTSVIPDVTQAVFKEYECVLNGIKHGTVMVIIDHTPVEITTYRSESDYTDHRHPKTVQFVKTLEEDVKRRDFTINGLAYHPALGIVDTIGGVDDLNKGIIRCIKEASTRFEEDALRILRALRFSSTLGFTIEEKTRKAIFEKKNLLKEIAIERINEEFSKLLCGQKAETILQEYTAVFQTFWPTFTYDTGIEFRASDDLSDRLIQLLKREENPRVILKNLKYPASTVKLISTVIVEKERDLSDKFKCRKAVSELGQKAVYRICRLQKQSSELLDEILENQDCVSLKQLAIHGEDLKELSGLEIKSALQFCLDEVMNDRVYNNKECLIKLLEDKGIIGKGETE